MTNSVQLRHPVTAVRVVAVRTGHHLEIPDQVATEEPMEIRAAGPGQRPAPVAVTMRTPGHDFDLAVGFLLTEGVINRSADVAAVKYCDLPDDVEQRFNTVTVELTRPLPPERVARNFAVNASCGVCGKTSIDEVTVACPPLPPVSAPSAASPPSAPGAPGATDQAGNTAVPASLIHGLPDRLRAQQKLFDRTGGLHAAAIFNRADLADPQKPPTAVREDVGRHNAVDKLAGHALLTHQLPLTGHVLVVSGRVSFEIVQKAAIAGLAVIVAVSAPSSLAVEAAHRLGVTIAGFVRGGRFNIYSHPERIDLTR
ncbi:MAG: FdhD protein [Acidimicrobiaceae bacterium]|nr:FdhD protein [Acidimicrobiaceae bacterium]